MAVAAPRPAPQDFAEAFLALWPATGRDLEGDAAQALWWEYVEHLPFRGVITRLREWAGSNRFPPTRDEFITRTIGAATEWANANAHRSMDARDWLDRWCHERCQWATQGCAYRVPKSAVGDGMLALHARTCRHALERTPRTIDIRPLLSPELAGAIDARTHEVEAPPLMATTPVTLRPEDRAVLDGLARAGKIKPRQSASQAPARPI